MSIVTLPGENKVWVLRIWHAGGTSASNRVITGSRSDAERAWKMELARYGSHTRITLHPIGEAAFDSFGTFEVRVKP